MIGLEGRRIAILAANGFEYTELFESLHALNESGATCEVISIEHQAIRGWRSTGWAEFVPVDLQVTDVVVRDFDGLLIAGGVLSCDALRGSADAVRFVNNFFTQEKPVAVLSHGSQLLIDADAVDGRRLTSPGSIRTDLENAGADWIDEPVVVDGALLSGRDLDSLPAFIPEMVALFGDAPRDIETPGRYDNELLTRS